jgi:hypothetical protein
MFDKTGVIVIDNDLQKALLSKDKKGRFYNDFR